MLSSVYERWLKRNVCDHRYLENMEPGVMWWCPGCRCEGTTPDMKGKPMLNWKYRQREINAGRAIVPSDHVHGNGDCDAGDSFGY